MKNCLSEHESVLRVRISVETRLTHVELLARGTFVALAIYGRRMTRSTRDAVMQVGLFEFEQTIVSELFLEQLVRAKRLTTKRTFELSLAVRLLMVSPYFHAFYVHIISATES
jgi:hypothetical protein